MNNENLVKYIETAYYLESELFELEEKIQIQKNFLQELGAKETANNKHIYSLRQSYVPKPKMSEDYYSIKNNMAYYKRQKNIYFVLMLAAVILIEIFIGIPLVIYFYKKHNDYRNDLLWGKKRLNELQSTYNNEVKKYNSEIATFDQRKSSAILRIEEENRKIVYMIEETRKLNDQLNLILHEKKKEINLYYEGIIHKNYQNLGSMSYFYDYLDTGRCDTLKECMNKLDDDIFHEKVNMNLHNIFVSINKNTEAVNRVDKSLQSIKSTIIDAASDISGILSDMDLNNFEYHNKSLKEQAETKKYVKNMSDIQHYRALVTGEVLPARW